MTNREQKAIEIADKFRITQNGNKWTVPSQSGNGKYSVRIVGAVADCTCPDHELRQEDCKHIMAVRYVIERKQHEDGTTTVSETFEVTKRPTYPQNWPAYNAAQTEEKDRFQVLLRDLCTGIVTPPQVGRGRRTLPLPDAIFAGAFKVYSTVSARRFMCDLRESKERGFITRTPCYNSIFNYLENPALTPILTNLIIESSLPLKAIEEDFAVDSTGFSTSKFVRWFDHKYGTERQAHTWVKVHIICGVKTNVVTAVEIRGRSTNDSIMLPALVESTAKNFQMHEVSADKGYTAVNNVRAIKKAGATPFIALKSNSTGYGGRASSHSTAWREMYYFFQYKREEFLRHYHKRSNVESTFSMMKRKFGDGLRSKTETAMVNESLCKILCHNLVVLIHEIHELGIEASFCSD